MAAKSQDFMVEGVRRILQFGGTNGAPLFDLPAGAGATDLETLLLAELRSRRERLAQWVQIIHEEVRRESAQPRPRSRNRRVCGGSGSTPRSARSR